MKIFLGTDITEIERIEAMYKKYGERFLCRTFSNSEIEYCVSKPLHTPSRLAVRFAVKESVSKALGVGVNKLGWDKGIDWKDVELIRDAKGAVALRLSGKAKVLEEKLGITNWEVSVSHSKRDAIATVIGYKE